MGETADDRLEVLNGFNRVTHSCSLVSSGVVGSLFVPVENVADQLVDKARVRPYANEPETGVACLPAISVQWVGVLGDNLGGVAEYRQLCESFAVYDNTHGLV